MFRTAPSHAGAASKRMKTATALITMASLLYAGFSAIALNSARTDNLRHSGDPVGILENSVFPVWWAEGSIKGKRAKANYAKRILRGIEIDSRPTALSHYEFYYFYLGYKGSLSNDGACWGIPLYPSAHRQHGEKMGQTALSRVLEQRIENLPTGDISIEHYNGSLVVSGTPTAHLSLQNELLRLTNSLKQ